MRPLALSGLRIARSCSPGKRSAPGERGAVSRGYVVGPGCGLWPYPGYALRGRVARVSEAHPGTGAVSRGYVVGPGCGLWPYPGYALRGHVARVSEAHPGERAQCPADTWLAPDAAFGLIRATHCEVM